MSESHEFSVLTLFWGGHFCYGMVIVISKLLFGHKGNRAEVEAYQST